MFPPGYHRVIRMHVSHLSLFGAGDNHLAVQRKAVQVGERVLNLNLGLILCSNFVAIDWCSVGDPLAPCRIWCLRLVATALELAGKSH